MTWTEYQAFEGISHGSTNLESNRQLTRTRLNYLFAAAIVVIAGLASRRYREHLPTFLAEYAGDTLWALLLFLLVSTLMAGRTTMSQAGISLVLAFAVEVSQLYHAPWIDGIRSTTSGGLVLGFVFLWSDLVCYLVGIATGAFAELTMRRWRGMRESHLVS